MAFHSQSDAAGAYLTRPRYMRALVAKLYITPASPPAHRHAAKLVALWSGMLNTAAMASAESK